MGSSLCFHYFFLFKIFKFFVKCFNRFEQTGDHKTPASELGFNLNQSIEREINTGRLVI